MAIAQCSMCGKPTTAKNGICQNCFRYGKLKMPCSKCGRDYLVSPRAFELMKQEGREPVCKHCRQPNKKTKEERTVIRVCEKCGKERHLRDTYVSFHEAHGTLSPLCHKCAKHDNGGLRKANSDPFELHGCVLFPSVVPRLMQWLNEAPSEGFRCASWGTCPFGFWASTLGVPKKEQCYRRVSAKRWDGYKSKGTPPEMTEEQKKYIREFLLESQGEVGILSESSSYGLGNHGRSAAKRY